MKYILLFILTLSNLSFAQSSSSSRLVIVSGTSTASKSSIKSSAQPSVKSSIASPSSSLSSQPEADIRSAMLVWPLPVKRENGEPMAPLDTQGCVIRYKKKSESIFIEILIEGQPKQYLLKDLPNVPHDFKVRCFDAKGLYSNDIILDPFKATGKSRPLMSDFQVYVMPTLKAGD